MADVTTMSGIRTPPRRPGPVSLLTLLAAAGLLAGCVGEREAVARSVTVAMSNPSDLDYLGVFEVRAEPGDSVHTRNIRVPANGTATSEAIVGHARAYKVLVWDTVDSSLTPEHARVALHAECRSYDSLAVALTLDGRTIGGTGTVRC